LGSPVLGGRRLCWRLGFGVLDRFLRPPCGAGGSGDVQVRAIVCDALGASAASVTIWSSPLSGSGWLACASVTTFSCRWRSGVAASRKNIIGACLGVPASLRVRGHTFYGRGSCDGGPPSRAEEPQTLLRRLGPVPVPLAHLFMRAAGADGFRHGLVRRRSSSVCGLGFRGGLRLGCRVFSAVWLGLRCCLCLRRLRLQRPISVIFAAEMTEHFLHLQQVRCARLTDITATATRAPG